MSEVKVVAKIEATKNGRTLKATLGYDQYLEAKSQGDDIFQRLSEALIKELNEKYPDQQDAN